MILIDTSVWIDFFRGSRSSARLAGQLEEARVLTHPWVIGELALGRLGRRRASILHDLERLPTSPVVDTEEVIAMIDVRRLANSGIGWVDAQLLASALVAGARIWTKDRKLAAVCEEIGLS